MYADLPAEAGVERDRGLVDDSPIVQTRRCLSHNKVTVELISQVDVISWFVDPEIHIVSDRRKDLYGCIVVAGDEAVVSL